MRSVEDAGSKRPGVFMEKGTGHCGLLLGAWVVVGRKGAREMQQQRKQAQCEES